jgi:putative transposase
VHCADSLPSEAVARLKEIHQTMRGIEPRSPQFLALQRRHFATLEKYLEAGHGGCVLRKPCAAEAITAQLAALSEWDVDVPHFAIMPNHWHALLVPHPGSARALSAVMKRVKGRSAKRIREVAGGHGAVWQREWFDRWMRNDAEWEKCVAYIRNNPVKAGLARDWREHPWTK